MGIFKKKVFDLLQENQICKNIREILTLKSQQPLRIAYARTEVSGSTYTLTASDFIIGVTYTDTGEVILTLPEISDVGEIMFIINDEGQGSEGFNIFINSSGTDTIGDAIETQIIINQNGASVTIYNNGIDKWFISGGAW